MRVSLYVLVLTTYVTGSSVGEVAGHTKPFSLSHRTGRASQHALWHSYTTDSWNDL